ncbi:MAG: hypothetical protein PVS3B1_18010 [Ktedonobacteraceae bacterium]
MPVNDPDRRVHDDNQKGLSLRESGRLKRASPVTYVLYIIFTNTKGDGYAEAYGRPELAGADWAVPDGWLSRPHGYT